MIAIAFLDDQQTVASVASRASWFARLFGARGQLRFAVRARLVTGGETWVWDAGGGTVEPRIARELDHAKGR